jgi:CheY-like chemotaxis protein
MKTILIVEDIELNRDLLAQLLEDDYRLVFAADGAAALERGRRGETRPDTDGSFAAAHGRMGRPPGA